MEFPEDNQDIQYQPDVFNSADFSKKLIKLIKPLFEVLELV